jgi:hypothetical protein
MFISDRATRATLASMAFSIFAAATSVAARSEESRYEHPTPREALQSHRHYATRPEALPTTRGREAPAHVHSVSSTYPGTSGRGASSAVHEVGRGPSVSQFSSVRYGNSVGHTVEHWIRPGLVSRTSVIGGRVLSTRVYQSHVWHQYGRAFAYETFVPAVRYPPVYYSWALAAWPHPISYAWGWRAQPWYPSYGYLFTPYPVYSSPDLWMTDYIIAQNMQTAYNAQAAAPTLQPPVPPPATDSSVAMAYAPPSEAAPALQASGAPPSSSSNEPPPAPRSTDTPAAPMVMPPAVTPAVKAQLDTQIKVQLQDRQAAAAMPATLTTESTPPALRPNHVFFEVVQPLNVQSGGATRYCSLSPHDYVKRTGAMSPDDWMVPVVVELSAPSDCPAGLQTRIGLNDLNAMENEQEAQVMEALQAASKSMGPNGPPMTPGAHPTLIAGAGATPDLSALTAIQQAQ